MQNVVIMSKGDKSNMYMHVTTGKPYVHVCATDKLWPRETLQS